MLRDRLVCGTKDIRVQRRLLAEPDLTLKKAFEMAQAAEVAAKDAKDLQKPTATPVLRTQVQNSRTVRTAPCYRCRVSLRRLSATIATKRGTSRKCAAAKPSLYDRLTGSRKGRTTSKRRKTAHVFHVYCGQEQLQTDEHNHATQPDTTADGCGHRSGSIHHQRSNLSQPLEDRTGTTLTPI
jgi:hypothetical protein